MYGISRIIDVMDDLPGHLLHILYRYLRRIADRIARL